jgi:hypothetical protein
LGIPSFSTDLGTCPLVGRAPTPWRPIYCAEVQSLAINRSACHTEAASLYLREFVPQRKPEARPAKSKKRFSSYWRLRAASPRPATHNKGFARSDRTKNVCVFIYLARISSAGNSLGSRSKYRFVLARVAKAQHCSELIRTQVISMSRERKSYLFGLNI